MKKFKRLLKYAKAYRLHLGLNFVSNLLAVIFSLISFTMVMPLLEILFNSDEIVQAYAGENPHESFSKEYLDYAVNSWFTGKISTHPDGISAGKRSALISVCLWTILVFFLKNLFTYLAQFFLAPARNGVIALLRKEMYEKILRLPIAYFNGEKKGDLISRMTSDVMEIEWGMVSIQNLFKQPISIVIFLCWMLFTDWELTLIILFLAPISALVISRIGKSLKRTSGKAQQKIGEVLSILEETLSGIKVVKAFSAEPQFHDKFQEANKRFYVLSNRVIRKRTVSSPLSETIGVTIFAIVLYIGGNRVFAGEFSGPSFITYLLYLWGLIAPIKILATAFNSMQKAAASIERVEDILVANERILNAENAVTNASFENQIEFENVSFGYTDQLVIEGLNLKIVKGKTVALVGHSGSGKSTLADLIPRFQEVTSGAVKIDGVNIKDIDLSALRNLCGIVTQESILFNDSVRNNLTLGKEGISDEAIKQALRIANANEFVNELEDGFNTVIGERGGKLSGGQKQRLCIARAVLLNPPVLILDEATSALDTASEKVVQQALENVLQNRTAVVIAHRLSTIRNADEIVVLDKGKIVEQGSHDALMEKQGAYAELCKMQNWN